MMDTDTNSGNTENIKDEILNDIAEGFDKIEHDIPILQQIVALRPEIEEAVKSGDTKKHDSVIAKLDELQEGLQSVELF